MSAAPPSSSPHPRTVWGYIRRYLTVGIGSAVSDLGTYSILTHVFAVDPVIANLVSRPAGGLFSFTFNRLWTFRHHRAESTPRQFARFWAVWLCAYGTSEVFVALFSHGLRLAPLPSKLCAEALVSGLNFVLLRHWAFRQAPEAPGLPPQSPAPPAA